MADTKYIRQVECLDHPTHILGEIPEVIAVGRWLVTIAMAAAVERINGVTHRQFTGDLIPDLGDKAGAVQQQSGRFARAVLAPSGKRNVFADRSDRNPFGVRHGLDFRASSRIIVAPFSAIIAVGVLVLPDVIVGITDASATRKPAMP